MGEIPELPANGEDHEQTEHDDHRRAEERSLFWGLHDASSSGSGESACFLRPECATMVLVSAG